MAKFECSFKGDFQSFLKDLNDEILNGSISASLEDSSDFTLGDTKCAVRVYERYSWSGSNRVSLNVTVLSRDGVNYLSAITSGGSQAMFFKINTIGEEAFLSKIADFVEKYIK